MAIFKRAPKNTEDEKPKKAAAKKAAPAKAEKAVAVKNAKAAAAPAAGKGVILSVRATEKSAAMSERSVYTFMVAKYATKPMIAKEFEAKYKIKPMKIATVKIPRRTIIHRGRYGHQSGATKAYIYLKKGQTIDLN